MLKTSRITLSLPSFKVDDSIETYNTTLTRIFYNGNFYFGLSGVCKFLGLTGPFMTDNMKVYIKNVSRSYNIEVKNDHVIETEKGQYKGYGAVQSFINGKVFEEILIKIGFDNVVVSSQLEQFEISKELKSTKMVGDTKLLNEENTNKKVHEALSSTTETLTQQAISSAIQTSIPINLNTYDPDKVVALPKDIYNALHREIYRLYGLLVYNGIETPEPKLI